MLKTTNKIGCDRKEIFTTEKFNRNNESLNGRGENLLYHTLLLSCDSEMTKCRRNADRNYSFYGRQYIQEVTKNISKNVLNIIILTMENYF